MASFSSSSSVNIQAKYDIFLSFRGEDTRHNFTSHLYSALIKKHIAAFIDDDGLRRGDEISPALLKAIEDSIISVIIFSKDYASSRWCLDELTKIIECKNSKEQIVVPVFYHIEPSDVRKQTGSFEKAFVEHQERFKETPERVQSWRAALTQAADLSGYHVKKDRPESKLVDEIVGDILKKLVDKSSLSDDCDGLVGINSRIEQIKSLLSKSQVVGIWGMGGLGKTTLVKVLFNQISREFDGCCFIENVREELERRGGRLLDLQQKIISRILGENPAIDTPNTIPQVIKNRLQRKKVLIVLDDVNDSTILERLIGGLKPLGEESKIVITTRDKQVLLCYGVDSIYEVEKLNYEEGLLLFCKRAFKQNHPIEDLQQFAYRIMEYVGGNPLAIRVAGSTLYGKSKELWNSVIDNLEIIGGAQINDVLKISFDALQDMEKRIFLDIACFFKGENEDFAKRILKACYPSVPFILDKLVNKSLLNISNDELQMHDLLQEMGRRIVYQESENDPSKRSRLWQNNDIYDVLQNNKGTEVVESILFDMSRSKELHLSSKAFVNMKNLRLLKIYWPCCYFGGQANISRVCLPQGLEYLPNNLRYLRWDGYPLKALPSQFCLKKLVALELPYSNIEEALEETKRGSSLIGCLRHTFSEGCKRLLKVPSSIQYFTNLQLLNMDGCHSIRRFPRNIHFTASLNINLSNCINLKEFPNISGNVKELCLADTSIEEVPASIASLSELVSLNIYGCRKLKSISTSICKLRSLRSLCLSNCLKLEAFPEIMEEMKDLRELYLFGTAIKELPASIGNLTQLEILTLENCAHLETIPSSFRNLLYLKWFEADRTAISQLPSSIACWNKSSRISDLSLSDRNLAEFPEVICSLSSLKELDMSKNNFKSVPKSIKQLSQLIEFQLNNCNLLQSMPELPLSVVNLSLNNCMQLQWLPERPSNVEQLDSFDGYRSRYFKLDNCLNLSEKISLERMQHMATALRLYYGKVPNTIPYFCFQLPGSEIPDWFNYQNFGSSITIQPPQQYFCNRRLIGFALSAVITFKTSYVDVCVKCKYSFANGVNEVFIGDFWGSIESDHIVLGFSPCMDVRLFEGQCTSITFEMFDICRDNGSYTNLKCCGVCPIYEEPNMTLSNTSIERFASTDGDLKETESIDCSITSGSGDGRSSDEEVEPHPKRIRRSQT